MAVRIAGVFAVEVARLQHAGDAIEVVQEVVIELAVGVVPELVVGVRRSPCGSGTPRAASACAPRACRAPADVFLAAYMRLSSRLTQTKPPKPICAFTSRSPASALQNRFWKPCSSREMSMQLPLRVERPGVKNAGDALRVADGIVEQRVAAMRADVVEAAHRHVFAAHDDERRTAGMREQAVVEGGGNLGLVAGDDPRALEELFLFFSKYRLVGVDARVDVVARRELRLGRPFGGILGHDWLLRDVSVADLRCTAWRPVCRAVPRRVNKMIFNDFTADWRERNRAGPTVCRDRRRKPRFSHCSKLDCAYAVGYKTGIKTTRFRKGSRPHHLPYAHAIQRGGHHANEIDAADNRAIPRTILAGSRPGATSVGCPPQLPAPGHGDCGWRRCRRCLVRARRATRDSGEQQGHGQAHSRRRLWRAVEVRGARPPPPHRRAQESAEFLRLEHDAAAGPVRHRHAERLDLRAPSQRYAGDRSGQAHSS